MRFDATLYIILRFCSFLAIVLPISLAFQQLHSIFWRLQPPPLPLYYMQLHSKLFFSQKVPLFSSCTEKYGTLFSAFSNIQRISFYFIQYFQGIFISAFGKCSFCQLDMTKQKLESNLAFPTFPRMKLPRSNQFLRFFIIT